MTNSPLGVGNALRSIAFNLYFYSWCVVMGLTIPLFRLFGGRAGAIWICTRWSNMQRWGVVHILRVKVVIEGHVPSGAVFVALKHESMFEAIDLPTLLPFPAVFAKVELLHLPLWGKAAGQYGLVPVERDQGAKALRAMVSAARKLSQENRPLAIFPEGTRVRHGTRPALQAGFAGLYKMIGLPVVPVAVNSGRLLHGFWKRRGTVTYRFGEVIPAGLPREEIEARVREAINQLNAPEA
jgi:1-acyl-sn-glycerol-3-phosphate acyltransferase